MERAEYHRHSRARMAEAAKEASSRTTPDAWSASTIGGAAPDTIIGRAAADRAGARPYRATRCENASKICHDGSRLSLANVSFWTAVFGCGSATGLGSLRSSSANLEQSNPEKRWCCDVLPGNCDLPTCLNENLVTPLTGSYSAA
jgi:hypothetical protein